MPPPPGAEPPVIVTSSMVTGTPAPVSHRRRLPLSPPSPAAGAPPRGNMTMARANHTATLLPNGKVLVVGGCYCSGAEVYDPRTGRWSPTGPMIAPHAQHTATLPPHRQILLASAELYDVRTGRWTPTTGMIQARQMHTATLLRNGKVLGTGGSRSRSGQPHRVGTL